MKIVFRKISFISKIKKKVICEIFFPRRLIEISNIHCDFVSLNLSLTASRIILKILYFVGYFLTNINWYIRFVIAID